MDKEDKKLEQAARAAWMYYVAGKTQQEVAELLGVSRQVAQRLVSAAKDLGMVKVQVTHPISRCLQLAEAIKQRYGLSMCTVAPTMGLDDLSTHTTIVHLGAEVMADYLSVSKPLVVGVGSGKTLRNIIDRLTPLQKPNAQCVSLIGAIAMDSSATRYDVSLWLAEKLQCKYYILPAPMFADDVMDRQQWCQHRIYQEVATKALTADVTFIGIGEIELGCPLNAEGFIMDEEIIELKKRGVVSEMLGHFVRYDGERLQTDLNDRLTTVPLTANTTRQIIAFAGGAKKHQAIKAALLGKWVSGLVTDEVTAQYLLDAI